MATVAKAHADLDLLLDMSQMAVSQMTATSTTRPMTVEEFVTARKDFFLG
jgi:hypothetical protein